MSDLLFRSATETAELIRHGEVGSAEVVRAQLDRIRTGNPALNALIEVHADQALDAAGKADRAVRHNEPTDALHGVPISVKEAFGVAGFRSTWGNPGWAEHRSDRDATVVSRLIAAGAITVGTSNVPVMLADFGQTDNPVYGRTVNPWDPGRAAGGSTGGGAAAVAAGLSFLDYGSDLAGSVRIPAAFCGVYGLKPTVGIVPGTGFQPPGPPAPPSERTYQVAFGPLARSAADIRAALVCTAGPEPPRSHALRWSLPAPRHSRLTDFRVRYVLDHPAAPVGGDVGSTLSDALDGLARAGVTLTEGWPDGVDPVADVTSFGAHLTLYFAHLGEPADLALPDAIEQERHRMASRQAWQNCLTSDADVFLCPTVSTVAIPHDDRPFADRTVDTGRGALPYRNLPFWIAPASLTGLPALSAPLGGRLPVGLQVVGPLFEDDTAITFADLAADVIGGYRPPAP
ncbi:MAG TPA: amidase family protein [Actinoplanes sp.]